MHGPGGSRGRSLSNSARVSYGFLRARPRSKGGPIFAASGPSRGGIARDSLIKRGRANRGAYAVPLAHRARAAVPRLTGIHTRRPGRPFAPSLINPAFVLTFELSADRTTILPKLLLDIDVSKASCAI
jgi:hypothetical protein